MKDIHNCYPLIIDRMFINLNTKLACEYGILYLGAITSLA